MCVPVHSNNRFYVWTTGDQASRLTDRVDTEDPDQFGGGGLLGWARLLIRFLGACGCTRQVCA